jgi:hypothetical protein
LESLIEEKSGENEVTVTNPNDDDIDKDIDEKYNILINSSTKKRHSHTFTAQKVYNNTIESAHRNHTFIMDFSQITNDCHSTLIDKGPILTNNYVKNYANG